MVIAHQSGWLKDTTSSGAKQSCPSSMENLTAFQTFFQKRTWRYKTLKVYLRQDIILFLFNKLRVGNFELPSYPTATGARLNSYRMPPIPGIFNLGEYCPSTLIIVLFLLFSNSRQMYAGHRGADIWALEEACKVEHMKTWKGTKSNNVYSLLQAGFELWCRIL